MIINGRVVSEYDFFYRRDRDKRVRKHREAGYPGEYRLVLDGLVLEHTRYHSTADWWFFDHIRTATTDPEHFVFNGYGGNGQRAGPWLEHHRARFDLPSWSGELTLVDPKNNLIDRFIFGKAPMLCTEPVGTITTLFGRFPCRVEISPAVSQERGYYTYQPQR